GSLLPPERAAYFPPWETLPHERLSPRSDTSGQRIAVLRRLARPSTDGDPRSGPLSIVATPVRGLLQPIVGGLGLLEPVALHPGDTADLEEILTRLVEIGYARTELVEKRGDIAIRGGMLADRMDLLLDYLPPGGCVLVCDPERIRTRAADLVQTSQEFLEASWGTAAAGGDVPIDLGAAVFRPITEVRAAADSLGLPWWTI